MRVGQYEIVLLHGEDAFAERLLPDGKFYASAEPSREYSVQVNIYRDIHGSFPAKYIRIGLYVDGYDVQYWKRIDFSDLSNIPKDPSGYVSSRFWGFKEGISDVRAFKFAEPTVSSEPRRSHQKPLGSIRMVVHAAYLVGGVFDNKARTVEGSIPAAADPDSSSSDSSSSGASGSNNSNNVYEGKKFWQQASLTTATGAKIAQEKEQFNPVVKWLNTSETPIAEMTLYYHTKSTLDLLEQMQRIEMGARASAPAARGGSTGTIASVGSKRSYSSSGVARVFGVSEDDNADAGEDGEEEVGGGILSSGVVEHTRIVVDLTGDDDDTADTNSCSCGSGSGRDGHATGAGCTTSSSSGGDSSIGAAARNTDAPMSTIRPNSGGGSGYGGNERAGFANTVQSAQPEDDTGASAGAAAAAIKRALAMGSSKSHADSDIQPVEVIVEDAPPLSY